MKRRDFLQLTSATLLIPALSSIAKPKVLTLQAFCRDVLKVKLTPDEQDDVAHIEYGVTKKGYRNIGFNVYEAKLAACVALWAAYTHPESIVWIYHPRNVYPQVMSDMAWDAGRDVWDAYVQRVLLAVTHYPEPQCPAKKPGDWHIFV